MNMKLAARSFLLGMVLAVPVLLDVPSATADLTILVDDASIQAGSTAFINVYISSDATAQAPDTFDIMSFQFLITTQSGQNDLQFTANPPTGFLTDSTLNPLYVMFGNSLDVDTPAPFFSAPSQTNHPNDTINGSDFTSTSSVSLSGGIANKRLLGILEVTAPLNLVPPGGDTATIALVPGSGTGGDPLTFFDSVPFTSTPGTITIIAAVPEPTSVVSLIAGLVLLSGAGVARLHRGR